MYVLEDCAEFAVIDPSISVAAARYRFGFEPRNFKHIILTHAHFDHMLAIDEWVEQTNAAVYASAREVESLKDAALNCYKLFLNSNTGYYGAVNSLKNGDRLNLGKTTIEIYETPGHTCGSISLMCENYLFTGDTVFCGGSVGRTDLPTGDYNMLMSSVAKLLSFDEALTICPGHGEQTTIHELKKYFAGK